ncbi:MAG: ECF transporter S component [Bacilli bacterium]
MEKLLISSCLLGNNCRYDGKNNKIKKLNELKKYYELVPVCPEVDGGLPTPRIPSEISNDKVINKEYEDNTSYFKKGAEIALSICKEQNITKALLKSNSPSCGSNKIYDGTFTSTLIDGDGVTAKLLKENQIKVFTENDIDELLPKKKDTDNTNNKKLSTHQLIKKMCLVALFAAITFIITFFLQIPISNGAGYLNLSDAIILLAACIIDPVSGAIVGAIGAGLADLFSGYGMYVPFTIVIKALEALIAGYGFKKLKQPFFKYLFIFVGALCNPIFYTIPDGIFFELSGLLSGLPMNTLQACINSIISIALVILVSKLNIIEKISH